MQQTLYPSTTTVLHIGNIHCSAHGFIQRKRSFFKLLEKYEPSSTLMRPLRLPGGDLHRTIPNLGLPSSAPVRYFFALLFPKCGIFGKHGEVGAPSSVVSALSACQRSYKQAPALTLTVRVQ